ncbi:MAG TPA: hypothetical protein VNK94_07215 [Gaiellaceae bacterium]|jgi:hypothetical protein|nr:hypothetical protein [Gaiellaceae bacterium]
MSKKRRSSIVLGALALVACFALASSVQASASSDVPFAASDRGSWGVGTHDCGSSLPVWVETSGVGTHVGRYRYSSRECADLGDGTYAGSFTVTAANGDTIEGSYAGTFTVDGAGTIHYEQTNTITGGTGRFAGASGSFHVSGLAYGDGGDVQRLSGAISRVGES